MIKKIMLFVAGIGALISMPACSDDDEPIIEPTATINSIEVEGNVATVAASLSQVDVAGYYYTNDSSEQPTAATILAANSIENPSGGVSFTLSDLKYDTNYTVYIAGHNNTLNTDVIDVKSFYVGEEPATDLGTPANCYIVTEAGYYSFNTKHVDGTDIDGVVKVDWLWATKDYSAENQSLISDVRYSDGKVYFRASENRGNVVLAGFNALNEVVWTWHIWMTEQPQDIQQSAAVFMDRFVGATSAKPEDGVATWGLAYQWGRTTPLYAGTVTEMYEPFTEGEADKYAQINPQYDFKWGDSQTPVSSVEEAFKSPTTYIEGAKSPVFGLWMSPFNYELWGREKTNYDPCPAGYRVASKDDWPDFKSVEYDADNKGYRYTYNGVTAWWPSAALRGYNYRGFCTASTTLITWTCDAPADTDPFTGEPNGYYYPLRWILQNNSYYFNSIGNPGFALVVRPVKI
jgi:hypothetical protein